jgi:lysophospholipase-3
MPQRFRDQRGVDVRIENYGKTESAPFYEPMYEALEEAGYVRDRDIRVAGYDSRLTPDMRNFLHRAKRLIEDTYRDNGNQPVHVVGHSNGPLYIQYLLTHTSQRWKDKYIHGFTPFAGNFPGQGILYPLFFTGLDVRDFTLPTTPESALSGAEMMLRNPSSYMSASDPRIFGDQETVVEDFSTGETYTPRTTESSLTTRVSPGRSQ